MTTANLSPIPTELSAIVSLGTEVLSAGMDCDVDVYIWNEGWKLAVDHGVTSRSPDLFADVVAIPQELSEPMTVAYQEASHAIIPFGLEAGLIAVLTDPESSVEQLKRLAKLAQQNLQLRLNSLLHDESEHDRQDHTRSEFLETIVQQLNGISPEHSISDVAAVLLPSLSEAINAQSIAIVPKSTSSRNAFVAVGDEVGDLAEWERIVEAHWRPTSKSAEYHRVNGVAYSSIRDFVIAPIRMGESVFGWLVADIDEPENLMGKEKLIASHMSVSAAVLASYTFAAERLEKKEQLLLDVVRSLVSAIDAKDPQTCGHSVRVAIYASLVAEGLELSARERDELYLSGLLHDVGKIGIPESIFHKSTALTEEEFDLVKQHPDHGWKILHRLEGLRHILPGVVHHHESYDGLGYPDQIAGDDIPLAARILAVVDAYDALTSERPYRKGKTHDEAMVILNEGAGVQWDPLVVETIHDVARRIKRVSRKYRRVAHPWRIPGSIAPQETEGDLTTDSTSETTSRYDAFGVDRI